MPDGRHHLRRRGRQGLPRGASARGHAHLRRPHGGRHPPADAVPGAHRRSEPGAGHMTTTELPLVPASFGNASITDRLLEPVLRPSRVITFLMLPAALGTLLLLTAVTYTFLVGIGAWGNNIPVAWAFAIINFVWWIGIGHA